VLAAVWDIFSAGEVASCVTNASVNVGTGVVVVSNTKGLVVSGVCVGRITVGGSTVGEAPPSGVGVAYCPHNDVLPPQDANKSDAVIKRPNSFFTNESVDEDYTCRKWNNLSRNLIQPLKPALQRFVGQIAASQVAIVFDPIPTGDPAI
jgi:hypothetical protein